MTQPIVIVTYAVSTRDLLALSPVMRERVEAVLQPHLQPNTGELATQRRERILPLSGVENDVRRAIYWTQTMPLADDPLRCYVAYAPGLWDVAPPLKAIALMRVQEGSYGCV